MKTITQKNTQPVVKFDLNLARERQATLDRVALELKQELFGIDHIIDRVIDLVRAWYIMPQVITRPVIINLWGLTGVGKTQLVRTLVHRLGFAKKFVEVQMDGFSNGSGYDKSSISAILGSSAIEEGEPGIILLDEMQRFRTHQEGEDIKVERFQDVWMLLSDGKFSVNVERLQEIEMMFVWQQYQADQDKERNAKKKKADITDQPSRLFNMYPEDAQNFKKTLKLTESVEEIMAWPPEKLKAEIHRVKVSSVPMESDYSKLLVFISGNLDEVFPGANDVDDCDTDADIYHEATKLLSQNDIKGALAEKFRPEQIARLGNNNIIYPSLNSETYMKIIKNTCHKYVDEIEAITGMRINLNSSIFTEIYNNAVYPTQGTRPVFSTIHQILGSALADIALWSLENQFDTIDLDIDANRRLLIASAGTHTKEIKIELNIQAIRKQNTVDFLTLVGVHEVGHALTYMLLNNKAPMEVKINLASFKGGYVIPSTGTKVHSEQDIRNEICVCLAGAVAEELVFGRNLRTTGDASDRVKATKLAASYVRVNGFGKFHSHIASEAQNPEVNLDVDPTNAEIEAVLHEEHERAIELLNNNKGLMRLLVNELLVVKTLEKKDIEKLIGDQIDFSLPETAPSYAEHWKTFEGKV